MRSGLGLVWRAAGLMGRMLASCARMREIRRRKLHAENWSELAADLAYLEWNFRWLIASGVRTLLAGGEPDVSAIRCAPMPAGFAYAVPQSAEALTFRMDDIARILADPLPYMRRIAARILRTPLRLAARATSPADAVEANATALSCLHRQSRGRWIATPSSRDGGGMPRAPPSLSNSPLPQPQKLQRPRV